MYWPVVKVPYRVETTFSRRYWRRKIFTVLRIWYLGAHSVVWLLLVGLTVQELLPLSLYEDLGAKSRASSELLLLDCSLKDLWISIEPPLWYLSRFLSRASFLDHACRPVLNTRHSRFQDTFHKGPSLWLNLLRNRTLNIRNVFLKTDTTNQTIIYHHPSNNVLS